MQEFFQGARHRVAQHIVESFFSRLELRHVLRPAATQDYDGSNKTKVDTVTPELAWEYLTLGSDDHLSKPVTANERTATFDIEIYDEDRLVYRRTRLATPNHTLEPPLDACRSYFWSVRPRFEITSGLTRVGEWMRRSPKLVEQAALRSGTGGEDTIIPTDRFPAFRTPCSSRS